MSMYVRPWSVSGGQWWPLDGRKSSRREYDGRRGGFLRGRLRQTTTSGYIYTDLGIYSLDNTTDILKALSKMHLEDAKTIYRLDDSRKCSPVSPWIVNFQADSPFP